MNETLEPFLCGVEWFSNGDDNDGVSVDSDAHENPPTVSTAPRLPLDAESDRLESYHAALRSPEAHQFPFDAVRSSM